VAVVDRAAAFGSFAPLGGDVRALNLRDADVVDFVAGVGGMDVTPATLRWALEEARSSPGVRQMLAPVYVPEVV
jgi:hypothetical protein